MRPAAALLLALLLATSQATQARIKRSHAAIRQFVQQQACPSTGLHRLPCPGYQIDHKTPLKCNGPDTPANMQWLTVEDHKDKTHREIRYCTRR